MVSAAPNRDDTSAHAASPPRHPLHEPRASLSLSRRSHIRFRFRMCRWARDGDETNSITEGTETAGLLALETNDFAQKVSVLPAMQFEAARLLMPLLKAAPNPSYTFVTGGAGEVARSPLGQINAQAVWGVAAALRQETRVHEHEMRCNEVRVGIRFNRTLEERRADPREQPLSHDIGHIVAGLAAATTETENALHHLDGQAAVGELKQRFPVVDKGYSVYYSPEDLLL